MAALPPQLGAKLWDDAVQGSDHTAPPGQPPMIPGGPEGVCYAPAGYLASDELGVVKRKTTDVTLNTGWVAV